MGFSRQECWSELPCHPPENLPNPGTKPTYFMSPALAGRFFTISATWEALFPTMEYYSVMKWNEQLSHERTCRNFKCIFLSERNQSKQAAVLYLVAQSCPALCDPMDCRPQAPLSVKFPGKNIGEGSHAFLQGIFPTQGSNPGPPNCKWILYCLSHQGSPRILEWVAYPFSRGSSWPRKWTGASCIAGRFFTSWATKETLLKSYIISNSIYMTFWKRQNCEDSSCQEFSGREVEMHSRNIGDFHRAVKLFWKMLWLWSYALYLCLTHITYSTKSEA